MWLINHHDNEKGKDMFKINMKKSGNTKKIENIKKNMQREYMNMEYYLNLIYHGLPLEWNFKNIVNKR